MLDNIKKEAQYALKRNLKHIAFIMDGNGRWAKEKSLPRHLGHKKAIEMIIDILNVCLEYEIEVISLYAFSTENWSRPQAEINHLFNYLEIFFKRELNTLVQKNVKLIISGDVKRLPLKTQKIIKEALLATKENTKYILNICLNYGGQQEILMATKEIIQKIQSNEMSLEDLDLETFANHLYTKGLPNVDLMIRTSGEKRLSNYLLWQNAYSEFIFPKVYWPDFKREHLIECFKEYDLRQRRFGGLKNET